MTGYTLALASVIPLTGWAADRFGTKRLYLLAVVLFTAGSVLCAIADTLEMLVAFRVLQGLGGGMLMPLGMTILTRAAGPDRVGRVMAVLGIPMLLGPIFGPILGGWLIDSLSWHWIFLINLPIGIAAIVYACDRAAEATTSSRRSPSTSSACCCCPRAWRCSSTASPRSPRPARSATPRCSSWSIIGLVLIVAFVPWALRPKQHPPADRPAAVEEPEHDRRRDRDDAVRDRVLRRQPAVPAVLPGRSAARPPCTPACCWRRRASARC